MLETNKEDPKITKLKMLLCTELYRQVHLSKYEHRKITDKFDDTFSRYYNSRYRTKFNWLTKGTPHEGSIEIQLRYLDNQGRVIHRITLDADEKAKRDKDAIIDFRDKVYSILDGCTISRVESMKAILPDIVNRINTLTESNDIKLSLIINAENETLDAYGTSKTSVRLNAIYKDLAILQYQPENAVRDDDFFVDSDEDCDIEDVDFDNLNVGIDADNQAKVIHLIQRAVNPEQFFSNTTIESCIEKTIVQTRSDPLLCELLHEDSFDILKRKLLTFFTDDGILKIAKQLEDKHHYFDKLDFDEDPS